MNTTKSAHRVAVLTTIKTARSIQAKYPKKSSGYIAMQLIIDKKIAEYKELRAS